MKITKHITFFYIESRLQYLNKIIEETNKYEFTTDIFIHTNVPLSMNPPYTNGKIEIVVHDLTGINPHRLTWKCRDLLSKQKDDYDIFMYIEDDILVPFKAIEYWLQYKSLTSLRLNLGFVRIETSGDSEFITDLPPNSYLQAKPPFAVTNYPYCAFWIYDKHTFQTFVNSRHWNLNITNGPGIREFSAFGMNYPGSGVFQATVIPLVDSGLDERCKIYHLPNNYVNTGHMATIKFKNAVKF
jgi:hypothetical protein